MKRPLLRSPAIIAALSVIMTLAMSRTGLGGACCRPDDTCEVAASSAACQAMGGSWQGAESICEDGTCPESEGACCMIDGTCAIAINWSYCNFIFDGIWQGGGSSCAETVCTEGACCLPDGSCVLTSGYFECEDLNGLYRFPGSVCADCCRADLNGNGSVGFGDLMQFLGEWGSCLGCDGDLTGNGTVGMADLAMLLAAWGPCPGV